MMAPMAVVKRRQQVFAWTAAAAASMLAGVLWFSNFTNQRPAAPAQPEPEAKPAEAAEDAVALLDRALAQRTSGLVPHHTRGYLDAVLGALHVPAASQVLVHSKTSRQREIISPENPRAIYFNDVTAVAWVPGGEELELLSFSPRRGGIAFYTLSQTAVDTPRFKEGERCFECHTIEGRGGLQGWLMRSLRSPASVPPESTPIDDRTPFAERWSGWFVSGARLPARHRGRPVPSLPDAYLSRNSDVVALMVLGHQVRVTNLLAAVGPEVARATAGGPDSPPEDTQMIALIEELAAALTFEGETPLPAPIAGGAEFRDAFGRQGTRHSSGRSLRDVDLETRLFRHGVSYMVHSSAFASLPNPARSLVVAAVRERLQRSRAISAEELAATLAMLDGL
jgi:hypothetical protein